ncbi:hypothetical protein GGS24DRAFT_448585 [Hypoxylon argillaceum]|nr:hypothetical protein GGS24DRAFT_448585 [Hypoxylon argillaceum]
MPKKRDFLGSGRYGVVYGTTKYAIKQIDDKDAFDAEVGAYSSLNKVRSLRGRIPKFYGINPNKRAIYLQRINKPTLRQALPDESTLLQIKQHLLETIKIIHEYGWCHGDINLDNIFASDSGLLFDFSHAHTKSKLSAQVWEDFQKKDRRDIRRCCIQAMGLKKLEAAITLLDSGVDGLPHQVELAELLSFSDTSAELIEKLEKIRDPIPSLALKMCQAFRCEGRHEIGMRLLQKSNLPIPCDDESRRLNVKIQAEIARCVARFDHIKACRLFAGAVRSSIDLLGSTDEVTIYHRVTYVEFLEDCSWYSSALDVLFVLKADCKDLLHPWREHTMEMEKRLRYKRIKKRHRERPMPEELRLIEDDKENIRQSEPCTPSKKQKLTQES